MNKQMKRAVGLTYLL